MADNLIKEKLSRLADLDVLRKDAGDVNFAEFVDNNHHEISEDEIVGKNVLDIGANVGLFSMICCALGAKRILAVEPAADNFAKLSGYATKAGNIFPVNCAVFDESTSFVQLVDSGRTTRTVPSKEGVQALSFASLASSLDQSDRDMVLKLDVEGSEYDILLKASASDIRRFKTIFLETHPVLHLEARAARTADFLKEYLCFLGYSVSYDKPYFLWTWDNGVCTGCSAIQYMSNCKLVRID